MPSQGNKKPDIFPIESCAILISHCQFLAFPLESVNIRYASIPVERFLEATSGGLERITIDHISTGHRKKPTLGLTLLCRLNVCPAKTYLILASYRPLEREQLRDLPQPNFIVLIERHSLEKNDGAIRFRFRRPDFENRRLDPQHVARSGSARQARSLPSEASVRR